MRVIIPIAFIDTPEYNWFEAAWPSGLRQWIANPLSRVRIPVPPPFLCELMGGWWNGRHEGLKIPSSQGGEGSTPSPPIS